MTSTSPISLALLMLIILGFGGCASTQQRQSDATTMKTNSDHFYIGVVKHLDSQKERPASLSIVSAKAGYLVCFLEDKTQRLMRFFPNRFHERAYVKKNIALNLPGDMPFTVTSSVDDRERVGCFLTQSDILARLPDEIKHADFAALPYDMPMITKFFRQITDNNYSYTEVAI